MAAHINLTLETNDVPIATLREEIDRTDKFRVLRAIVAMLLAVIGGTKRAYARVVISSAVASQTITVSASGGVPTDTLVVGGTTLTNAASPANESEFADAATDALLTASVVACINAHSVLQKYCWAKVITSSTFKIFCKFPGPIGNFVTLAETGNGFSLGGAVLASGASDESDDYQFGYAP